MNKSNGCFFIFEALKNGCTVLIVQMTFNAFKTFLQIGMYYLLVSLQFQLIGNKYFFPHNSRSKQTLIKCKQSLVDFKNVVVALADKVFNDNIEFITVR